MTQRDLQPLISDAMDEGDMRQETRDLVHLQPPSWRRTAVERCPYRTIRNVPLRGATGSSQTESMEM